MRIHVGNLGFTTPKGFRDTSAYSFQTPDRKEKCEVEGGRLPREVRDLDAMLKDRRGDLEDGLRGVLVITGQGRAVLDGLPARTLTFGIREGGVGYQGSLALALDTPGSYVQIAYACRADDAEAVARFGHIVASASFTVEGSATPEGFIRRWAGKLWLDVPAHLEPPLTYQFLSPDETMRLLVSFVRAGAEPSINSEIDEDTALGEVVKERGRADLTTPHAPYVSGTAYRFVLTRGEDGISYEDVVRRAHLAVDGVPAVHVYGRAPTIDEPALDAAFDALVASVERVSGGARR